MSGERPAARVAARKGPITSAAIAAQRLGGGRLAFGGGRDRASPGVVARLRSRLPRLRPFRAVTVGVFSLALVGIVTNAMVFQRGRHPAPLFGLGQSVEGQGDAEQRNAALKPVPVASPPKEATGAIVPAPAPVAVPAAPAAPVASKAAPAHHAVTAPHPGEPSAAAHKAPGSAEAHPRPGHATAKAAVKPAVKPVTAPDAVAKLLAQPSHPDKAIPAKAAPAKAAPAKVATPKVEATAAHQPAVPADAGAASHPRHHLAAAPAADGAHKPSKPE